MCASAAAALWAWSVSRPPVLAAAVCVAFLGGGAALSSAAWERAWRPPLLMVFEDLARVARRDDPLVVSGFSRTLGRSPPLDDYAFAIVEGELRADAALTAAGVSLSVEVDGLDGQVGQVGQVGVIVTVVGSIGQARVDEWRAGRRVRFPAQLHRPARYLDPGVPDMERALARRGTRLVGTVKSGALVEVLSSGGPVDELFGAARAFSRRAIERAVGRWSTRSAAIVSAIVIGDRAGLDDEVQRRLQEAGTFHVIAISGGNIAILAGLLLGAFRLAGALGPRAMIAAIALLVAYAQFVSGGASVDRATLMAVVYLSARALDHRTPPLNSLALAAGCLVAAEPLSVADPGFLFTFGATLAILLAAPVVSARKLLRPVRLVFGMLIASAATEALLFPVGALVFSRVTFAGLALNFLAIPLMGVAQVAGMAVIGVAAVSANLAAGLGWVAHIGAEGLVRSADLVRFAPFATWRVAAPSALIVLAYYVSLAIAWTRPSRRVALAVAAACAVWMLAQPWTLLSAWGDGALHVTFIDVGQGDAAFVRFPGGSSMLVDAGGLAGSSSFDIGDRVVAPVLREAGIRRLDYLVLTHGDPDHIGGAGSVIAEFRPRTILEGVPVPRSAPLAALRAQADLARSTWTAARRADRLAIDGVDVRVLHPPEPDWERQKVRNDDSIVLELAWRDVSLLFTGDIGREVERDLPPFAAARQRVLKVPHHGSLTSSSEPFVQALTPTVVVASAGRSNRFGHPVPLVLQRYEHIGAQIFRTDRDGAVTVHTDGHSLQIRTFATSATAHHEDTKVTKDTKIN